MGSLTIFIRIIPCSWLLGKHDAIRLHRGQFNPYSLGNAHSGSLVLSLDTAEQRNPTLCEVLVVAGPETRRLKQMISQ